MVDSEATWMKERKYCGAVIMATAVVHTNLQSYRGRVQRSRDLPVDFVRMGLYHHTA